VTAHPPNRLSTCRYHRWRTPIRLLAVLSFLAACHRGSGTGPAPTAGEISFQRLRLWHDRVRMARALGWDSTIDGSRIEAARDSLSRARQSFSADPAQTRTADPITQAMQQAWRTQLKPDVDGGVPEPGYGCPVEKQTAHPAWDSLRRLEAAVYQCYGAAANSIVVDGDTLNRLAILGLLSQTPDRLRRERLFRALEPVWRSVDGPADPSSAYRHIVALRRTGWSGGPSPIDLKGAPFGLGPAQVEGWLLEALGRFRSVTPDMLLEPWDWYYENGRATAALSQRLPTIDDLRRVNRAWYARLGADPERLRVYYNLAAGPGKDPVAYTDFAERNRWVDGRLVPGRPWVSASYLAGGFDNLTELLHETGHAIHIAGIRTRPAFVDWPDDDTFTEALADVAAAEAFEPSWQITFLGDSIPLARALRAKYAWTAMDMAWALFEIRIHREPGADPNAVWTAITTEYLRIRPHPEWSWWAMRGQLIDSPGYLVNYAIGAFITADIRHRIQQLKGPMMGADSTLYPWLVAELYQFGGERPSARVLEDFLGRRLSAMALLADLDRIGS